jgi:hypothetical protein
MRTWHGDEMSGIYASRISAGMMNIESIRNWANELLVAETMDQALFAIRVDTSMRPAFAIVGTAPLPTGVRAFQLPGTVPESFKSRFPSWHLAYQ